MKTAAPLTILIMVSGCFENPGTHERATAVQEQLQIEAETDDDGVRDSDAPDEKQGSMKSPVGYD
jgi:hypothetical protein